MNDSKDYFRDRALFIILSSATIMFLVFSAALYGAKEKEKESRINIQSRLDETLAAKEKAESVLREIETENAAVKASLKAADDKLDAMSRLLEEEKASGADKDAAIKKRDEEAFRLKTDFEELRAERDRLVGDLEKLNYDHQQLKAYLDNIMKTNEEMDRKARELAERYGVSLGTIVLNQGSKKR